MKLGSIAAATLASTALLVLSRPALADEELTARNKALVRDFYTTVLVRRDVGTIAEHWEAD